MRIENRVDEMKREKNAEKIPGRDIPTHSGPV
jgi:hypothetical protein